MIMWAGFVVIVFGLLEEVMYATLAARHLGGEQHLIVGLVLLAVGILMAVYDGIKGNKEHAQIVANSRVCPVCGMQLTEDCKECPRCGEAVE